jgi:predicted amidohydrolase YtcJ
MIRSMSMPNFLSAVLIVTMVLSGCSYEQNKNQTVTKPQVLVFIAKSVLTMNDTQPSAKAVAVEGDKIVAVGTIQSIQAALPDYQLTIDNRFIEKVITPGFIDNHLHPTLAGILLPAKFITPFDWSLPSQQVTGVQGRQAYLERLVALEASLEDPAEMLITWGYHQYFHGQIRRADLDRISSTRPIIVWQRSFHEIIVNTPGLFALGIDEEKFPEHPAINLAEGHFWETGLFDIFPRLAPIILEPERLKSGMYDALLHAQMNGITTLADQGAPLMNLDMETGLLSQVLEQHSLPLRMLIVGHGKTLAADGYSKAVGTLDALPLRDNQQIQFLPKQVKLLADGAFYSQLMQMEDPYLDGHHGEWIMPPEDLEVAARTYWDADFALHIHVNGDKGLNVVLGIIEKLQAENPRPEHRTVLHHYGYSAPEHAKRIADMGISVSANPFYLWALGDKYAELGLGPDRAHNITRLGDLERNGVSVSFHSDLPMAPAAPLVLAGIAASRVSSLGNVLAPNQKMSVAAALRGITIEAARAIQQEQKIGSIEVGKQADFTILQQDPLVIAPENFKHIEIWGTVLGGQIHPRPAL